MLPFASGSAAESVYRPIAERLSKSLAQPIIIDNRPGDNGVVANRHVKNAAPDGYTICVASNSTTTRSVGDQAQINILRELVEDARAHPGKLSHASYGVGSGGHMFYELLANDTRIKCALAHFQSGAEAAAETAAGRTQIVGSITGSIAPHAASGKLRLLAVSTQDRFALAPDLPGPRGRRAVPDPGRSRDWRPARKADPHDRARVRPLHEARQRDRTETRVVG